MYTMVFQFSRKQDRNHATWHEKWVAEQNGWGRWLRSGVEWVTLSLGDDWRTMGWDITISTMVFRFLPWCKRKMKCASQRIHNRRGTKRGTEIVGTLSMYAPGSLRSQICSNKYVRGAILDCRPQFWGMLYNWDFEDATISSDFEVPKKMDAWTNL